VTPPLGEENTRSDRSRPRRAMPVPDVITSYFGVGARRDIDAIVALFADDAIVVDEGKTWRGVREIPAWQEGLASLYQYTTEVSGTERIGENEYLVTGRLEGNFPEEPPTWGGASSWPVTGSCICRSRHKPESFPFPALKKPFY
jgi:hypothetical protein